MCSLCELNTFSLRCQQLHSDLRRLVFECVCVTETPHSVGLTWTRDWSVTETSNPQFQQADKRLCGDWDRRVKYLVRSISVITFRSLLKFFSLLDIRDWPRHPHCWGFVITLRHTTLGRTSLDKRSVRRRDLNPTTTKLTRGRYPCLRRDSNSLSQHAIARRHTPSECATTGVGNCTWIVNYAVIYLVMWLRSRIFRRRSVIQVVFNFLSAFFSIWLLSLWSGLQYETRWD
jgi:hypothetical protein